MISPLLHALSAVVNDPQRRSPGVAFKAIPPPESLLRRSYHRTDENNTNDADSSPCISAPEIRLSVCFSCFQEAS